MIVITSILFYAAIGFVIFLLFRRNTTLKPKKMNYYGMNRTKILLFIYGTVLLAGTILYFVFPFKIKDELVLNSDEVNQIIQEQNKVFDEIYEGKVEELNHLRKDSWEFPLSGNKLQISGDDLDFIIAVEKKENDGVLEVIHYMPRSYTSGTDITNYLPKPNIQLNGSNLIIDLQYIELEFAKMEKEITINQFTEDSWDDSDMSIGINMGALLLRIPENVNLNNPDIHIIE
jgi:hypothetical protein